MPATAKRLFWSPDSSAVGFWAESEIRTVPAAGGPVFMVCKVPATGRVLSARWLGDGTIVFAVWRENVYSVPAAGGTPVVAVAIDPATEIDIHHISPAPGGRLIVTIHLRSHDRTVVSLVARGAQGQPRVLLTDDQTIDRLDYVSPGFVIFNRLTTNAGLWAVPFTSGPIEMTRAVLRYAGAGSASAADDGSVVFEQPARSRATLTWIDRAGAESAIAGTAVPEKGFLRFALAPDARHAAIVSGSESVAGLGKDETSLLVRDLATGSDRSLTFRAAGGGNVQSPSFIWGLSWFPSGDRLLVTSGDVGSFRLAVLSPDEASPPRDFVPGLIAGNITRDGRVLAGIEDDRGRFHLMYAPVSADGAAGTPQRVFGDNEPDVIDYDLSPDGRFVVFSAGLLAGPSSVYVAEFPVAKGRWLVSESATAPRFSPKVIGRRRSGVRVSVGPQRAGFFAERFDDGREPRDFENLLDAQAGIQELALAAAVRDAQVGFDHRADAGAVHVGDVVQIHQDVEPTRLDQLVYGVAQVLVAILENQAAVQFQNRDTVRGSLCDMQGR